MEPYSSSYLLGSIVGAYIHTEFILHCAYWIGRSIIRSEMSVKPVSYLVKQLLQRRFLDVGSWYTEQKNVPLLTLHFKVRCVFSKHVCEIQFKFHQIRVFVLFIRDLCNFTSDNIPSINIRSSYYYLHKKLWNQFKTDIIIILK